MVSRSIRAAIEKAFPNDVLSQKMALNAVETYANNSLIGEDRVLAMLPDFARLNGAVASGELTTDAAFAQLSGLASTMGIQQHAIDDGLNFLKSGAGLSAEDIAGLETPGAEPAQASPAIQAPAAPSQSAPAAAAASPALADRAGIQRRIGDHERNMRAEPGTDAWKAYYKSDAAQAEYRALHEALQSSTDALSKLGSVAPPVPSEPAPAPAPAAPAPTTQAPPAPGA